MSINPNEILDTSIDEEEITMPSGEQIPDDMLSDSAPILGDTPEGITEVETTAEKQPIKAPEAS